VVSQTIHSPCLYQAVLNAHKIYTFHTGGNSSSPHYLVCPNKFLNHCNLLFKLGTLLDVKDQQPTKGCHICRATGLIPLFLSRLTNHKQWYSVGIGSIKYIIGQLQLGTFKHMYDLNNHNSQEELILA